MGCDGHVPPRGSQMQMEELKVRNLSKWLKTFNINIILLDLLNINQCQIVFYVN